jgi:hypothetical protein
MQKRMMISFLGLGLCASIGCAGDGSSRGDDTSGISGDGDGDGDGNGDGDGDGDGTGDGDGDGDGDGTGDGDGDGDHKWDLGGIPDASNDCADGGGNGDPEFSYLWAANSSQGTISKIDTQTVTEVGRFITSVNSNGNPSRTSVSATGNVAVGNRNSGVTKFYANIDDCVESNGTPGIQTSQNATALSWDQEECRAWNNPFNYFTQRPVAWVEGTFNEASCEYENERLWTSGITASGAQPEILLLNGDTGEIEESVQLAGWEGDQWGIYGGAVDGDGNFWGSQLGSATNDQIVKVNIDDMTYQTWAAPSGPHWYGMTVDSDGYVWLCSSTVGRFNPDNQSWDQAVVGGSAGCMADAGEDGLLWMAAGQNVIGVNRETLVVEKTWNSNGAYGVSIDFYGYVWAVAFGTNATRVDPDTGEATSYAGLVGAYTYSDMTGYALANAGVGPDG